MVTLRSDFARDLAARRELERFLFASFGLDLGPWDEAGYWDERYVPFSLFEGERIVSSACLYSIDLVVEGESRKVAQLSGVATLPGFRRRGLAGRLTQEIVARAATTGHEGSFLFADREAAPFYERRGFEPVEERAPLLAVGGAPSKPGLRKLDMTEAADRERVFAAASGRTPVSGVLGAFNEKLLMFHALGALRDHVYEIRELGVVVFFRIDAERLTIYDVVGCALPRFAALHPYLAIRPHSEVLFRFEPDRLGVEPTGRIALSENGTHLLAPFRLPRKDCTLPFMVHA